MRLGVYVLSFSVGEHSAVERESAFVGLSESKRILKSRIKSE